MIIRNIRGSAALIALALFSVQRGQATDVISSANLQVFGQVVDGEVWKTTFTLLNLGTAPASFTLYLYGDTGLPLNFDTNIGTGNTFTGSIPAGGSKVIETLGVKPTLSQGWGLLRPDPGAVISGSAVFRARRPNLPDLEASVPGDGGSRNRMALPYDHVAAVNGVALVNPGSFSTITVSVVFRDESGALIVSDSFQMAPLAHFAIVMTQQYPQTIGHRGTMEISTPGLPISVLGLRFNGPTFTSIVPVASASW